MIYSKDTFGHSHSCTIRFEIVSSINWELSPTKSLVSGYLHHQVSFSVIAMLWLSELCESQSLVTDRWEKTKAEGNVL